MDKSIRCRTPVRGLRGLLAVMLLLGGLPLARAQNAAANNGADAIDELVLLLQAQLAESREQNTDLRRRLDTLATELEGSRTAYQDMAGELVARDARIQALEGELQAAADAPPAVDPAALVAAEREARELAVAVADLAEAKRGVEDQNTLFEGRIQDLQRDLERLATERDAAQAEAESARAVADQREQLEGRVADLQRDLERLATERDAAVAEAEAARTIADEHAQIAGRLRDLQRDVERLTAERDAARAEAERLRDPGEGPAARIAELERELDALRDVEAQRKETMEDLFRQLADLRRARETDSQKRELLEAERDVAREETGLVRTELAAAEDELRAAREALAGVDEGLAEAAAAREALAGELAAKAAALDDAAAEHTALRDQMRRLTGTDEQRRRAMDELLARLAGLEEDLKQAQLQAVGVRGERDAAQAEAAGLREELDRERADSEQAVARLERDRQAAVEARDELAGRIGRHEVESRRLTAQIEELDAEVARLRTLDSQRRQTMDNLMLELAQAEDRARSLAAELAATQAADPDAEPPDPAVIEVLQGQILELENTNRDLRQALEQAGPRDGEADGLAVLEARAAEARGEAARLRDERDRLQRQLAVLEAELVDVRAGVEDSPEDSAAVREEWERERAALNTLVKQLRVQRETDERALDELRATVDELRADNTRLRSEVDALERVRADIQRDSDLFRAIEQANVELREKATEAEAGRARAERALDELDRRATELESRLATVELSRGELEQALAESRERADEKRELVESLMVQVPDMERQLAAIERDRLELQVLLAERNNAIDALRVELDNREHRLAQAERVVQVLEGTRDEVTRSAERERRDMHYNMAAVYARDGRIREAEAEYLRALEIDSTDPDVHYNLGILYDDELGSPEKAARHYRRYLRLRPHGEDADIVRQWLRRIEMGSAR